MSPATPAFTPDYSFVNLPLTDLLEVVTDQLELGLNGGQSTDDSPYPRPLLRLCVEEAKDKMVADTETANKAILQADYLARKKDEQESYFLDLKAKNDYWETPDRWIQSFPIVFLFDQERGQQYFILPQALVNLRRYQNLPSETGLYDIQARNVQLRDKWRFAGVRPGASGYRHGAGGSLGRFMYHIEQNTSVAAPADQHRCYITAPRFDAKIPADVRCDGYMVVRDDRTSGLPPAALRLVTHADIYRIAAELAILRTRPDKLVDNSPSPTNPVN